MGQVASKRTFGLVPQAKFSVKSSYLAFTKSSYQQQSLYPFQFIWNKRLPSKVSFFLWTAADDKCLAQDNLRKRGLYIVNGCLLCKAAPESINHLLLHCSFSWKVWTTLMQVTQNSWTMYGSPMDLALAWKSNRLWSPMAKYIWSLCNMLVGPARKK